MEENYLYIGKIKIELFSDISQDIITDEVILTKERQRHIIEGHREDFELYSNIIADIIKEPDYILKDYKNSNTAMIIKHIDSTNINIILRLAVANDDLHLKNSIMTLYRIRDKNLRKLQQKNKTIYKKE